MGEGGRFQGILRDNFVCRTRLSDTMTSEPLPAQLSEPHDLSKALFGIFRTGRAWSRPVAGENAGVGGAAQLSLKPLFVQEFETALGRAFALTAKPQGASF